MPLESHVERNTAHVSAIWRTRALPGAGGPDPGYLDAQTQNCHVFFPGEWWGADENCVELQNVKNKTFLQLDKCRPHLNITQETHNCTNTQTSTQQGMTIIYTSFDN